MFERTYRNGARIQIHWFANCMWVKGVGHWNEKTAIEYKTSFQTILLAQRSPNWCCVLDIRDWDVSTPEAKPHFQENTQWCLAHGMQEVFILVGNNQMALWNLKTQSAMTGKVVPRHYFEDTEDFVIAILENTVLPEEQVRELLA